MKKKLIQSFRLTVFAAVVASLLTVPGGAWGGDLPEVKKSGVLRHLGIPYAKFVTGAGDGMDVELIQKFARYLEVRYEYVQTDWDRVVEDLIGQKFRKTSTGVEYLETVPVRGDLIANGFTILPWREKVVNFSEPTFPSQIWLIARADSAIKPIKPSTSVDRDIIRVKSLLAKRKVMVLKNTCLDPDLYKLQETGAELIYFSGGLNEIAPAIINGEAEMTILDVPDTLVALGKWPGKIKVIGPISPRQEMGTAFPKSSPRLRDAYNKFLRQIRKDGTYTRLVNKYYPTAFAAFPDFFKSK